MRFLFQTIHKLISKELPRPLGRWKIEECSKKMNYKNGPFLNSHFSTFQNKCLLEN